MSQEAKILTIAGLLTFLIIGGGIAFLSSSDSKKAIPDKPVEKKLLVKTKSYQKGPKDAKVTIVEFGDFQCPSCAAAHPNVKKILEEYGENISFTYRHFPLPQHKYAMLAAEVSEAAGEQGKFWEMYDRLYEEQEVWSKSDNPMNEFTKYAIDLKLHIENFKGSVLDEKYKDKILQDEQDGKTIGIRYTPTFFINGKIYEGAPTYNNLKTRIDEELQK